MKITVLLYFLCFNSRTREDATVSFGVVKMSSGFNSRTREDATFVSALNFSLKKVSIHAPVRMRPLASCSFHFSYPVSIHAPVRMRHPHIPQAHSRQVSIHAPVRMRPRQRTDWRMPSCFNSRTREDATIGTIQNDIEEMFQFTHP